MNEKYLHYLWQNKLLPFHQMSLSTGESFKILYVGDYNETESGPDFFNGQISIDGIVWSGNIELHIRSSDWYRHGHQHDPAYNNVILHVVYNHDKEVVQNGRQLPVMELKGVVNSLHYTKYVNFFKRRNPILCSSQIATVEKLQLVSMQERALLKRISRKTEMLEEFKGEPIEALYLLLAKAMGAKVNQLPFEELARRIPYRMIKKVKQENRQNLLLQVGGLALPERPSEMLLNAELIQRNIGTRSSMNPTSWKYGGVRPAAAPDKRIRQFAALIEKLDPELFVSISKTENLRAYFQKHFKFYQSTDASYLDLQQLSSGMIDLIIINAIAPFLWWLGQIKHNDVIGELAFELLGQTPAENNTVISKWKKVGVKVENAYQSQAMLEIFNEFCFRKKCLSCGIGKTLLDR